MGEHNLEAPVAVAFRVALVTIAQKAAAGLRGAEVKEDRGVASANWPKSPAEEIKFSY